MATRAAGLVPRTGEWRGVFTGTDLISRPVSLALNRRGTTLTGQLSILVTPSTGRMGTATFRGTHVAGRITLNVTVPGYGTRRETEMKITGRLVRAVAGGQAIVATTVPARRNEGTSAFGLPLNGTLVLRAGAEEETIAFAEDDGGAWVDPGGER